MDEDLGSRPPPRYDEAADIKTVVGASSSSDEEEVGGEKPNVNLGGGRDDHANDEKGMKNVSDTTNGTKGKFGAAETDSEDQAFSIAFRKGTMPKKSKPRLTPERPLPKKPGALSLGDEDLHGLPINSIYSARGKRESPNRALMISKDDTERKETIDSIHSDDIDNPDPLPMERPAGYTRSRSISRSSIRKEYSGVRRLSRRNLSLDQRNDVRDRSLSSTRRTKSLMSSLRGRGAQSKGTPPRTNQVILKFDGKQVFHAVPTFQPPPTPRNPEDQIVQEYGESRRANSRIDVRIVLDLDKCVPGDPVSGNVVLNVRDQTKIRRVEVAFIGLEHGRSSQNGKEPVHVIKKILSQTSKPFKRSFWNSKVEEMQEEQLKFSFQIPETSPPTMSYGTKKEGCWIDYRIRATVFQPQEQNLKTEARVTVLSPRVKPNTSKVLKQKLQYVEESDKVLVKKMGCFVSGYAGIKAKLGRSLFAKDERRMVVPLHLSIENYTDFMVRSVTILLLQTVYFMKRKLYFRDNLALCRDVGSAQNANGKKNRILLLDFPLDFAIPALSSKTISVEHAITVCLDIPMTPAPRIMFPLTIVGGFEDYSPEDYREKKGAYDQEVKFRTNLGMQVENPLDNPAELKVVVGPGEQKVDSPIPEHSEVPLRDVKETNRGKHTHGSPNRQPDRTKRSRRLSNGHEIILRQKSKQKVKKQKEIKKSPTPISKEGILSKIRKKLHEEEERESPSVSKTYKPEDHEEQSTLQRTKTPEPGNQDGEKPPSQKRDNEKIPEAKKSEKEVDARHNAWVEKLIKQKERSTLEKNELQVEETTKEDSDHKHNDVIASKSKEIEEPTRDQIEQEKERKAKELQEDVEQEVIREMSRSGSLPRLDSLEYPEDQEPNGKVSKDKRRTRARSDLLMEEIREMEDFSWLNTNTEDINSEERESDARTEELIHEGEIAGNMSGSTRERNLSFDEIKEILGNDESPDEPIRKQDASNGAEISTPLVEEHDSVKILSINEVAMTKVSETIPDATNVSGSEEQEGKTEDAHKSDEKSTQKFKKQEVGYEPEPEPGRISEGSLTRLQSESFETKDDAKLMKSRLCVVAEAPMKNDNEKGEEYDDILAQIAHQIEKKKKESVDAELSQAAANHVNKKPVPIVGRSHSVPIVVRSNSVPILVEAIPIETKRSISVGPAEMETLPLITEVKILSSPPAGSSVSTNQKVRKSHRRRSSTFWKDSSVKYKPPPQKPSQCSSRNEGNSVNVDSRSGPSPPSYKTAVVASEETNKEEDIKAKSKEHRNPVRSSSTTGIRRHNNEERGPKSLRAENRSHSFTSTYDLFTSKIQASLKEPDGNNRVILSSHIWNLFSKEQADGEQ